MNNSFYCRRKPAVATPGKTKPLPHVNVNAELTLSDVNIQLLNQQLNAAFGNSENIAPVAQGRDSNASNNSDETSCTSATEIKERPSSATVVKSFI